MIIDLPFGELCEHCQRVILLENQFRQARARFRVVVENATCGIMLLDSEARFLYINRYITEVTGYELPEMLHRSMFNYTYPGEHRFQQELFRKTLDRPGELRDRGYSRLKNKSGVWVLLGLRVLNLLHDPCVGAIVVYATDESAQMSRYYGNSDG